ncbi:methyltransferase domain-containing protein [Colletotrichum tofieldiae]|nr:methyltransferase domain-containing protein [Colletotrichum tofieldiae]GKT75611.1 methyltransferase domain-containing protein [Colletotrichum tofieldiae]
MAATNNPVVLDADNESDDARSEIGSSIASSSTSLRDSILESRFENGRTYHRYKEGNLQHYIWLLVLDDTLGIAPPCREGAKVGRVLDVGTGTGIWAINFGDDHPESQVYGVDLSPTLPEYVPPNVRFEIDDIEEDWTYSQPFQYIHSRIMTSSINDWRLCKWLKPNGPSRKKSKADKGLKNSNLEPGGWLEIQEFDLMPKSDDGTLREDHSLVKWINLLLGASEKLGRPYIEIPPLKHLLEEIGFVDVELGLNKWPSNDWPKDPKYKEIGLTQCENILSGLEGFTMAPFTRVYEWTPEEVNVFLIDVRKDIKDRSIHAYWPVEGANPGPSGPRFSRGRLAHSGSVLPSRAGCKSTAVSGKDPGKDPGNR